MILPPPPRAIMCPRYLPGDEEGAPHVDAHHFVEGFLFQVNYEYTASAGAEGGVVNQDVDAAKLGQNLAYHFVDLSTVGNVCEERQRFTAHFLDFGHYAFEATPTNRPVVGSDGADAG